MNQPKAGDIVWYVGIDRSNQPVHLPAIVVAVHQRNNPESPLELVVFDRDPNPVQAREAKYSTKLELGTWSWPSEDAPPDP